VIRNRTHHARAQRAGLVSCGQILEELVERAADRRFYRPARRPKPRAAAGQSLQLELFADQPVPRDPDRPLFDLLPEAYTTKGL
jgi:hypothetical protein